MGRHGRYSAVLAVPTAAVSLLPVGLDTNTVESTTLITLLFIFVRPYLLGDVGGEAQRVERHVALDGGGDHVVAVLPTRARAGREAEHHVARLHQRGADGVCAAAERRAVRAQTQPLPGTSGISIQVSTLQHGRALSGVFKGSLWGEIPLDFPEKGFTTLQDTNAHFCVSQDISPLTDRFKDVLLSGKIDSISVVNVCVIMWGDGERESIESTEDYMSNT
eukprot:1184917-Prorocentrum_minimum.AAC.3